MTLSKLQAAYRKELNKSVKKGDKLKQQKVVSMKKLSKGSRQHFAQNIR